MSAIPSQGQLKVISVVLVIAAVVLWAIAITVLAMDQPPGPPPSGHPGGPPGHPDGAVAVLLGQIGVLAAAAALVVDVYRRLRGQLDDVVLTVRRVLAELAGDSSPDFSLPPGLAAEIYNLGKRSRRT